MTLEQLNAHLELVTKLQAAKETLEEMEAAATDPRGQSLTGMPSAHNAGDKVGKLVSEIDALHRRVVYLEQAVQENEKPVLDWIESIDDIHTWRVFFHRFILGEQWKEVAAAMGKYTSTAAVQHTCYRYINFGQAQDDEQHSEQTAG